jgi:hypothetical protein
MRGKLPLAGFALALLLASPALADQLSDGVTAIPGAVEDVRVAGTWDRGEASGVYRVVIARGGGDTVTARFFVQWVAYDDTGAATVENTIEIAEIGQQSLDVVDFTSESDADGLSVYIQAINPASDKDENYELFVFSPTEYRFGPSTN